MNRKELLQKIKKHPEDALELAAVGILFGVIDVSQIPVEVFVLIALIYIKNLIERFDLKERLDDYLNENENDNNSDNKEGD